MVKINPMGISRKLKMKKTKGLIKQIFGDSIKITDSLLEDISVKEENSQDFLIISLKRNVFALMNRKYFYKTYELAEKYEELFGIETGESTVKTYYSRITPNI